ncbi:MAG: hypothetical protein WD029_04410, partial [Microthrixaceae bacterium]
HLSDLPQEIATERSAMLQLIRAGRIQDAYELVSALPADLRVGVKPFFTAFTSGRTTEIVTAHAASDIVAAIIEGTSLNLSAQVANGGGWNNLCAPVAAPVVLGVSGWQQRADLSLAEDELEAISAADAAVEAAISAVLFPDLSD